ncbi:Permease of the drug/metabolite transporter (DMT) superfamily [Aeromonas sp. RU39B]|uniref:DMT family transporter n=1 Tax=Aeromonas sp. RU39B TaxID=1907416 RepID=UPI0009567B89|nr:DMT family transporter [Aeromonas sp. RU39B]SIR59174.1 Permease of the drug/metabolite transporter (DMT) superfamily [Aeromonas sp. RU39B]
MRHYLLLLAIGLLWGSQFIFMHQAVSDMPPLLVAAGRALCGSATLGLLCLWLDLGKRQTRWRTYMLIALLDATIPFIMVAWGQQFVDSAVAAVVMGCIPLVTVLVAPLLLSEERITRSGLLSVLLGLMGVIVLFWPRLTRGMDVGLLGALAILIGAGCFAVGLLMIKRFAKDHPVIVARNILLCSALQLLLLTPWLIQPSLLALPGSRSLIAVALLGVFCTGLVYFLYMALIQKAGPTFASFSNYLVPLFGVLLGALFLGEQVQRTTALALVLILGSVAINQWSQHRRQRQVC